MLLFSRVRFHRIYLHIIWYYFCPIFIYYFWRPEIARAFTAQSMMAICSMHENVFWKRWNPSLSIISNERDNHLIVSSYILEGRTVWYFTEMKEWYHSINDMISFRGWVLLKMNVIIFQGFLELYFLFHGNNKIT
jgi:hypothetical protein